MSNTIARRSRFSFGHGVEGGREGRVHLIQTVSPSLEELLAAATGEDPEIVGLEVGGDAMVPVRTWEVGEDE
ncbi:MAG TPA: hypothetical protein EYO90_06105 [Candidatus Latescibacteria bacterium]|nr:hypothetical protein [Candidatus Latescibacterota bacterium]